MSGCSSARKALCIVSKQMIKRNLYARRKLWLWCSVALAFVVLALLATRWLYIEVTSQIYVALEEAVKESDIAFVDATLTRMPWFVHQRGTCQRRLLHLAIERRNMNMIDLLLHHGAEIDAMLAVFWDDNTELERIISNHPGVIRAKWGCNNETLLHIAAKNGSTQALNILLSGGAKVDARSIQQWTPLRLAVFHAQDEAAKILIDNGAQRDVWSDAGLGDVHAVRRWLETDSRLLNARDSEGMTPLHWAAHRCHPNVIEQLITAGARLNVRTDYVVGTPLVMARKAGCDSAAHLLEEFGATDR